MSERTILNMERPITQCIDAIKALLSWRGRAVDPLPSFVEMGKGESRLVLVLSNKKDAYYTVTAKDCSCPFHNWHPNQRCKHQRAYFPLEQTSKPAAIKQPNHGAWHGHNGPIAPEETRAAKVAPLLYVDTTPESTPGELAYWSIQADREMWPVEA